MEVNEYKLRKLMENVLPMVTCGICPAIGSCEYTDEEPYKHSCVGLIIKEISEDNK